MTAATAPPRATRRTTRTLHVAAWSAILVVVTVAQLFRQTGGGPWRTVWAEDGGIFYSGTSNVTQLFDAYAGYAVVLPRLLGLGGHLVPIQDLAWYYAVIGAVVTTLCAVAVWEFSRQLVTVDALRAVLALSVVLAPTMLLEQLGNGVNTIWALAFAAWWAVLYRPETNAGVAARIAVLALAVLSQALVLAYAPVVLYQAWKRRDRPEYLTLAAFVAAALVQLVVIATATDTTRSEAHLADLPKIYSVRVLGSMLVSERGVADVWDQLGNALPVLALGVTAVALLVLFAFARGQRVIAAVTVVYSIGIYGATLWARGTVGMRIGAMYSSIGNRWSSLAIWFLLGAFCILAAHTVGRVRQIVVVVLVLHFAIVAALGFRGSNPRSAAPSWRRTLDDAAGLCSPHRSTVRVLVAPPSPTFEVTVACTDLR